MSTTAWAPPAADLEDASAGWQPPARDRDQASPGPWTPPAADADEPAVSWAPPAADAEDGQSPLTTAGVSLFRTLGQVPPMVVGGAAKLLDTAADVVAARTGTEKGGFFTDVAEFTDDILAESERVFPVDAERNPKSAVVGSGAGQALSLLAGGAVGRALGAGNAALTQVPLAAGLAMGSGEGIDAATELGVDSPEARLAMGALFGGVEMASERLGGLGGKAATDALMAAYREPAAQVLQNAAKAITTEGVEEVVAGSAQDLLRRAFADEDPSNPGFTRTGVKLPALDRAMLDQRGMEFLGGAAGGTVFAGVQALANQQRPEAPATIEGNLPGVPPNAAEGGTMPLNAAPGSPTPATGNWQNATPDLAFDASQINADQVRNATPETLELMKANGLVRDAAEAQRFTPPAGDAMVPDAPTVPPPGPDAGGVAVPADAGTGGPVVVPAPSRRALSPLPLNPDGDYDILNYLNENPINAPRRGTETGGEFDWREAGDFPPAYRARIMREGQANMDERAQEAFDMGLIPEPTPDALAAAARAAIANRESRRQDQRREARAVREQEAAQRTFEQQQQVLAGQNAPVVDLDTLEPGQTLTVGGQTATVARVEFDEDGRTTAVTLTTPRGPVRVPGGAVLRADLPEEPEVPLGLNRPVVEDVALARLSDAEFDQQRRLTDQLLDRLESRYDQDGDLAFNQEFRRQLGEVQDQWAANEVERFRRRYEDIYEGDLFADVLRMAGDVGAATQENAQTLEGAKLQTAIRVLARKGLSDADAREGLSFADALIQNADYQEMSDYRARRMKEWVQFMDMQGTPNRAAATAAPTNIPAALPLPKPRSLEEINAMLQLGRSDAGGTVLFSEAVDLAVRAVRAGVRFGQWAAAMVRRFGEQVRQYLQGAWQAARKTSQVGAINLGASLTQQNTALVSQSGVNSKSNLNAVLPAVESFDSFQSAPERPATGEDYNSYAPAQAEKIASLRQTLKSAADRLGEWQRVRTQLDMGGFNMALGNTEAANFAREWQAQNAEPNVDWQGRPVLYVSMNRIRQELFPLFDERINQITAQLVDLEAAIYLAEEEEGGRAERLAAKESAADWARRMRAAEFAVLLDARDEEAQNASSVFVAKVWQALAAHDEAFQFERTTSARAEDIASAVSRPGRVVTATDNGSSVRFATTTGYLDIFDANTARPYIRSTEAASQGKKGGGGAQLYQAALDWIHNNGKRIKDDEGLTDINAIRRTSNFMASALRWGTTRHLKPHAKQKVKWSGRSDARNIAALAAREMENAFARVAEARAWRYDFARNEFLDATGSLLAAADFESAILGADPANSGVGLSTLQRAVITSSAIQTFQRGGIEGAFSPASLSGTSRSGLKGILYFDPFGLMVAADALTRLAKTTKTLVGFTRRAMAEFGEWVKPYLADLWQAAKRGAEAVRRYLQGSWQAARKTSRVGAINLAASPIAAREATMADVIEGNVRESQFGRRVQDDPRLSPEMRADAPTTFVVQPQQAAHDQARAIIQSTSLPAAMLRFQSDETLTMPVRLAGLMQVAMNYDAQGQALRISDPTRSAQADLLTDQAVLAKAQLETLGNEAGRNLAMFNSWLRLSPDGMLRRVERRLGQRVKERVKAEMGGAGVDVATLLQEEVESMDLDGILDEVLGGPGSPTPATVGPVNVQTGAPAAGRGWLDRVLGGAEAAARAVAESATGQRMIEAIDSVLKALRGRLFADPLLLTPMGQAVLSTTRTLLLQGQRLATAVANAIAQVRQRLNDPAITDAALTRSVLGAVTKEVIKPVIKKLAFDPDYTRNQAVMDLIDIGIRPGEAQRIANAVTAKRPQIAKKAQNQVRQRVMARLRTAAPKMSRQMRQKLPAILDTMMQAVGGGFATEAAFEKAFAEKFNLPSITPAQRANLRALAAKAMALPEGVLRNRAMMRYLEAVAMVEGVPASDMIQAAWYANVLAGLSTQGINVWGNAWQALFGALSVVATNPRDAGRFLRGLSRGLSAGAREAVATLGEGQGYKPGKFNESQQAEALDILSKQGPQNAGQVVAYLMSLGGLTRFVLRALGSADMIFYYTAHEGMAALALSRTLRQKGLKPGTVAFRQEFIRQMGGDPAQWQADLDTARQELQAAGEPVTRSLMARRAWELRRNRREANVQEAGQRWADRMTFQQRPEGFARWLSQGIAWVQKFMLLGVPVGRSQVPFNSIVSNLVDTALDFTPIGALRGALGHHLTDYLPGQPRRQTMDAVERKQRAFFSLIGLSVAGALLKAALDWEDEDDVDVPFMIYAYGPNDKAKREQMPKGWRPFTIKIGDRYVGYSELPIGPMIAAVGGFLDARRYRKMEHKTGWERLGLALHAGAKSFTSQGVLSQVADLTDLLTLNVQGSVTGTLARPVQGFVPVSGLLRDAVTLFDDSKIKDDDLWSAIVKDLPVIRQIGTRPALNAFGEPVKVEGAPVVRRFTVKQRADAEADFLGRNKINVSGLPEPVVIGKYLPSVEGPMQGAQLAEALGLKGTAMENGVFTEEQLYRFGQRSGQLIKERVKALRLGLSATYPDGRVPTALQPELQKQIDRITLAARRVAMAEEIQRLR